MRTRPRPAVRLRGRVQRRRLRTLLRVSSRPAALLRLTRARRPRRRLNRLLRIRAVRNWQSKQPVMAFSASMALGTIGMAPMAKVALRRNWSSSKMPFKHGVVKNAAYTQLSNMARPAIKPVVKQTHVQSQEQPLPRLATWGRGMRGHRSNIGGGKMEI
jgi:hypothetical protein